MQVMANTQVYYPIYLQLVLLFFKFIVRLIYFPIEVLRLFKKPQKCPPITDKILLLRASELAEKIRNKEMKSITIIETYISRIKEVNPLINAIIQDRFDEAVKDAQKADDFIKNSDLTIKEIKEKYPLLGVPITIKGSLAVTGMRHTAGRVDFNRTATEDATIVSNARKSGAIPLLLSNIPELCLNWESSNKLIGSTSNPYNTLRSPAGSSGGEASLMGCGASLIGLGSDIAGSLRLPAHCCGVWGHKPSPHVASCVGHYPDCKNREEWNTVFTTGPMARYATDLKLLLKVIAEPKMRDILELDRPVDLKKLRFHYVTDVKSVVIDSTSDEVVAAVLKVVNHFDTVCDTKCLKTEMKLLKYCTELSYLRLLKVDGAENVFNDRGDGSFAEMRQFFKGKSNHEFTSIAYGILRNLYPQFPVKLMQKIFKLVEELRSQLIELLGENGVFILPTSPTEALYKGDASLRRVFNYGYCSIFNAMGFPSTNCPIMFSKNGLPIGIQVVAAPNKDRLTLAVAEELEKTLGGWKFDLDIL